MAYLRRMEKYYLAIILIIFIALVSIFYLPSLKTQFLMNEDNVNYDSDGNTKSILKFIKTAGSYSDYSVWPKFIDLTKHSHEFLSLNDEDQKLKCLNNNKKKLIFKISDLDDIIKLWSASDNSECIDLYRNFLKIYDVKFKTSKVVVPKTFESKVKSWLGNDDNLFDQVKQQELVFVYNRFTFEENVFNLLRGKRPQKVAKIKPEIYYKELLEETAKSCDFCNYTSQTASNEYGRLEREFSFSSANVFPFNEYHSLFLPRKHDLLQVTFNEFKELFQLPTEWYQLVQKTNPGHIYPILLWDFLPKGGASQVHPHLQCTINSDKYYGNFEIIRNGAENYFRATKNNYFNDFIKIHNNLGLAMLHKKSVIVFPLTPKKDFDVTILSEDFNDSVIELIYATIKTFINVLNIYPFSMSIYYPALTDNQNGRIPLYVKILPRGDLSTPSSELSSLELLSIFNANKDQYAVKEIFKNSLRKELENLKNKN